MLENQFRSAYLTITRKYVELSIEPALLILMASKTNLLTIMTLFKEKISVLFCLTDLSYREFIQILNTGLYMEAVEIFTGPAWRVRDQILPLLTEVPIRNREIFADALRNRGSEVIVPGVSDRRHP